MRECVVIEGARTPTGKSGWKGMAKGGQFANISAQDLLASAVEGLMEKVKQKCKNFKEEEIEDVCVSCLSQIGEQGGNLGRIVALAAGLPQGVAGWTVDRQAPGNGERGRFYFSYKLNQALFRTPQSKPSKR